MPAPYLRIIALPALLALLLCAGCSGHYGGAPVTSDMRLVEAALDDAMGTLDADTDDQDLLLITNAGYGTANGQPSEAYIDLAVAISGCTPGRHRLVSVVTPQDESLWFALYKDQTADLVFVRLTTQGTISQRIDLAPSAILTPEGWTAAKTGTLGPRTFSVVSMAMSWSAGAPWDLFMAAQLHDHFCPGLNAGYLIREYVRTALPKGKGDRYVFVGAPPFCAMDALQVLEGCTVGKKGAMAMMVQGPKGQGVPAGIIALRVNAAEDRCDGLVLGVDWPLIWELSGVSEKDMAPEGGPSNPMFHISRTTMSWKMAQMPMVQKMACVVERDRFTGPAKLAKAIMSAKADPYAMLP